MAGKEARRSEVNLDRQKKLWQGVIRESCWSNGKAGGKSLNMRGTSSKSYQRSLGEGGVVFSERPVARKRNCGSEKFARDQLPGVGVKPGDQREGGQLLRLVEAQWKSHLTPDLEEKKSPAANP